MPTLNIKDPEVYRLARELADQRGTSMTAVIRTALESERDRAPTRLNRGTGEIAARLMEIGRQAAAKSGPWLTDADLYDENGLPR